MYTSRGPRRQANARRLLLRRSTVGLIWVMATFSGLLAGSQAYASFSSALPDVHSLQSRAPMEDTLVFASDARTVIADVHPNGLQHYTESLPDMGALLPQATVATEDANFYVEHGLDPQGIGRAAWVDLQSHRNVEGGSTITQQLVKMRLLDNAPTLDRKLREAFLAVETERVFSKQQILEMYLNSVSYGNGAQGSRAAAQIYFHKTTAQLDLAEAGMLAGIPQNPTYNNPISHWEAAKSRQRTVLDAMVRARYISLEQADAAFAEDLHPPEHMFTPGPQVVAFPGFTTWAVDQLVAMVGRQRAEQGGLRVLTTVSATLQDLAQKAIIDQVVDQRWRNVSQGAMVSIDPRSGAVLAMVGAADSRVNGGQYDMAVWPPRNPGSSFKVFTYTAAIESGKYTMVSPVNDSQLRIQLPPGSNPPYYQPTNYDGKYHGTCQLQQCIGNSLNVPAVKVEIGVGVASVVQEARKLGAPPYQSHGADKFTTDDPVDSFGYSLTLGGYGETPLQMAAGVSVLAAQGVQHAPYAIQQIRSRGGADVFSAHPDGGKQVLDAKVAYIVGQMMSDDDNRSMIFGKGSPLTLPGRRVAAKTGTTDSYTDAWTIGFTPSLATAVWFGNPDYSPMVQGSDGIYVAAPAWHNYMQSALDFLGAGSEWFLEPPGLNHATLNGKPVWFIPGTSLSTVPPRDPGSTGSGGGGQGQPGPEGQAQPGPGAGQSQPGPAGPPGRPQPPNRG